MKSVNPRHKVLAGGHYSDLPPPKKKWATTASLYILAKATLLSVELTESL
jgi:hypothetical protein